MKNVFVVKILLYEQDAIFHHPYFGNPDSDQNDPDPQHGKQGDCLEGLMFSKKIFILAAALRSCVIFERLWNPTFSESNSAPDV